MRSPTERVTPAPGREDLPAKSALRALVLQLQPPWLLALLLGASALGLRLYQLGAESLWIDEGYSIRDARDFDFTLGIRAVRPLYYAFLSLWLHFGNSEFILRLPAALFGAGAVSVMYLLGRRLVSERAGLLAAALMAISPLHVNHSQEIRMYSLAALLSLLAMHAFVLFLSEQRLKYLLGYLAFTATSIATFPPAAFLLLIQNLAAFARLRGRGLRYWAGTQFLVLAAGAHFLIHTVRSSEGLAPERLTNPSALEIIGLIGSFSLFTNGPAGSLTWYAFYAYTLGTLMLIAFCALQTRKRDRTQSGRCLFLALWLVIPLILTAVAVRTTGAQWLPRYVIYASPAYFLLVGFSVDKLPNRKLKYLALAAVLALPVWKLARYYERPVHPEWREAVRFIELNERSGDAIAIYRPGNGHVFQYYYDGRQPWQEVGGAKLQKKRPWTEKRAAGVIGDLPLGHRRVWLVMSEHDPEAGKAIEQYIRDEYRVLERRSYVGIEMILFERQASHPRSG